jgi:molybdopterin converting factor small subunit
MKEGDTPSRSLFSKEKNDRFAILKLHGNLAKLPNGSKMDEQQIDVPITVGELFLTLNEHLGIDVRRDSTLVLVNGVEANALQDLDTIIREGDEVSLVPMFHGGVDRN